MIKCWRGLYFENKSWVWIWNYLKLTDDIIWNLIINKNTVINNASRSIFTSCALTRSTWPFIKIISIIKIILNLNFFLIYIWNFLSYNILFIWWWCSCNYIHLWSTGIVLVTHSSPWDIYLELIWCLCLTISLAWHDILATYIITSNIRNR